MGLASALSTALTGLNAAETTIDVVGNNVANANTAGFKASKAVFATQFLQTRSLGSAPTDSRGGTNPRQTGLGTKVAEITPDFTQGTIQNSASSSDLAIQGDGFFIVEGAQGERQFTRNGIFKTNSQNELVTINGQRLLGHGVDDQYQIQSTELVPLTIPLGNASVAQATRNVFLQGVLRPNGDEATLPEIIRSSVLGDGSKEVPDGSLLALSGVDPPDTSTISSAGVAAAGAVPVGDHFYRITFTLDSANPTDLGNESSPSDVFSVTTTAGQNQVNISGLPAIPAGYQGLNLYRSDTTADGSYTLITTLTAVPATYNDTAATGTTALDDSTLDLNTYGYYVTFYNSGSGLESRPTELAEQSLTVAGRRIQLSNIPQPASGDFNQVRIYRSIPSVNASEYRLVTTLNTGQTTYIDGATDADIEGNAEVNLDGPPISVGLALTDVTLFNGSTYTNPFEDLGTLEFAGSKGGRQLTTKTMEIDATTTVGDLLEFMSDAMGIQPTNADTTDPLPGNPGGRIVTDSDGKTRLQFEANYGTGNAIDIDTSSLVLTPSSGAAQSINLSFGSVQEAVGESAVTDFVVFDSLGISVDVRLTAILESKSDTQTVYRWFADSADNDPSSGAAIRVGTGQIVFDSEGNVQDVTNSTVSIERETIASDTPLEFDLDFSQVSGLASNADSSLAATRQDGSAAGVLASFIIGEDGLIRGIFSSGVSRDLGQIRLARFANNAGLEQQGENLFGEGVNSGLPIEGNPGEQGIGTIIAGAVELSNTDVGQNLIDLITASTQYRGGTRVITAVQQLLDELLNLRR